MSALGIWVLLDGLGVWGIGFLCGVTFGRRERAAEAYRRGRIDERRVKILRVIDKN